MPGAGGRWWPPAVITEVIKHPGSRDWREGRAGGGGGGGARGARFLQWAWIAAQVSQPKKQIKINKRQVLNGTDYDIKKGRH